MDTKLRDQLSSATLLAFRKQYPAVNSGDLQTFIIGWNNGWADATGDSSLPHVLGKVIPGTPLSPVAVLEEENATLREALESVRNQFDRAGLWTRDEDFMIQVDTVLYGPDTEREKL